MALRVFPGPPGGRQEWSPEGKKIFGGFEEGDCGINSGDVMVMDEAYEVYF